MIERFKQFEENLPLYETKEKYDEIFMILDPNGNRYLSLAEIDKGMVELWDKDDCYVPKESLLRAF